MTQSQRIVLLLAVALGAQSLVMLLAYCAQLGAEGQFGGDFVAFWEAAQRLGQGQSLYQAAEWQARIAGGRHVQYSWYVYPPFAAFGLMPLAKLSYGAAVLCWSVLPSALYLILADRLGRRFELPRKARRALIGFAAPLLLANLLSGQTGAILACLWLGAALNWERRPVLAGLLIGLCAIKPQLGLLLPFALAASGQWRTFAAAAVTVVSLALAATLVFGAPIWAEYFAMTRLFASVVAWDYSTFDQLALGPYLSLRVLGVPVVLAAMSQALIIAGVVWIVVRRFAEKAPAALDERLGLLALGTLLVTPYAMLYDLPLVVLALVPIVRRAWTGSLDLPLGVPTLTLVLAPALTTITGDRVLPVAFVALLAMFAILARRTGPERTGESGTHDIGKDLSAQAG